MRYMYLLWVSKTDGFHKCLLLLLYLSYSFPRQTVAASCMWNYIFVSLQLFHINCFILKHMLCPCTAAPRAHVFTFTFIPHSSDFSDESQNFRWKYSKLCETTFFLLVSLCNMDKDKCVMSKCICIFYVQFVSMLRYEV